MDVKTRKQEQAEATRAVLVREARALFSDPGYAEASIDQIAQRARVTKGALYHHFADKKDVFRAVFVDVSEDLARRVAAAADACEGSTHDKLRAACAAYLDACLERELQAVLLDATSVLGWTEWCKISREHVLGALVGLLQPLHWGASTESAESAAHLVLGSLDTGARVLGLAADVAASRAQIDGTIDRLLAGFALD